MRAAVLHRFGEPLTEAEVELAEPAADEVLVRVTDSWISPQMPLDKAALLGCAVLTGMGAVLHRARVRVGQTVAVIGCGGVGLNAVQAARLAGAGRIIAVDIKEAKLERARIFGATDTV